MQVTVSAGVPTVVLVDVLYGVGLLGNSLAFYLFRLEKPPLLSPQGLQDAVPASAHTASASPHQCSPVWLLPSCFLVMAILMGEVASGWFCLAFP